MTCQGDGLVRGTVLVTCQGDGLVRGTVLVTCQGDGRSAFMGCKCYRYDRITQFE